MKASALGVVCLALFACALFAQARDISGTWQGTLKGPNGDLRTVIKISKADDGSLAAIFYSIDQGARGFAASTVTLQGSAVKIAIPSIGGTFEGRLESGGNTITGTWDQGAMPMPLNLTRATTETAWDIPQPPPPPKLMAADANPTFEVASIKLGVPDSPGKAFRVNGRQFSTLNTTVNDLIVWAFDLHAKQIIGKPDWLDKDKYDLLATPGEGQPSSKQWKVMVQKLLADRFQLTFHHGTQELPVYAITVAKGGPKMAPSQGDPNGLPGMFFRGLGDLPARNANMTDLTGLLQGGVLDRPVVDQTKIAGRYDFELKWTPDETQFGALGGFRPPATEDPDAPPDLFKAMQDELGLKLEPTKASVDVLIIDHVAKPSPN